MKLKAFIKRVKLKQLIRAERKIKKYEMWVKNIKEAIKIEKKLIKKLRKEVFEK